LETASSDAVKAYTKAKKDDLAAAVEKEWSEFGRKAHAINLLALVDPKAHATVGEWKKERKALVCKNTSGQPIIQLPYEPGEEYDLEMTFRRVEGEDGLFIGLVVGGRRVNALIDGHNGSEQVTGLEFVDEKRVVEANPTTVKGKVFEKDKESKIVCSVRSG